jgi:hypothetical protein
MRARTLCLQAASLPPGSAAILAASCRCPVRVRALALPLSVCSVLSVANPLPWAHDSRL